MLRDLFLKYVTEHWDIPAWKSVDALNAISEARLPLRIASPEIDSYINDMAEEFRYEHNLDDGWFDMEFGDTDEVFYAID